MRARGPREPGDPGPEAGLGAGPDEPGRDASSARDRPPADSRAAEPDRAGGPESMGPGRGRASDEPWPSEADVLGDQRPPDGAHRVAPDAPPRPAPEPSSSPGDANGGHRPSDSGALAGLPGDPDPGSAKPRAAQEPAEAHPTGADVTAAAGSPGVPAIRPAVADAFRAMWRGLEPIGRHARGGYRRFAWTAADADCRAWFREEAERRGLVYEVDRNGNQWAWAGDPDRAVRGGGAVVTGSHLDSVPDGGGYDGPLGVVSGFAALDELRARGRAGGRPFAVVNFADEEGARFGVSCVGSRLACGLLDPERARALRDADGVTLAEAMAGAGHDPGNLGPDPGRLAGIRAFVELHVEQGLALARTGHPVGVGSAIWPHGRWRFDFRGEANHAGTTRLADRRDPMLSYATTVLTARKKARLAEALATFGRVVVEPGGVTPSPRWSAPGSTPGRPTRTPWPRSSRTSSAPRPSGVPATVWRCE